MSLQNAILGILTTSPMTGYYLRKVFDGSINYSWTASLSQIYRDLGTLEKKGFVSSKIEQQEDKPDKKIYSITKEGRAAFNRWLTNFPEKFTSPKRDEFMLRIFFGSKIEKEEMINQLKKFIEERENFKKIMSESKTKIIEMGKVLQKDEEKFVEENKIYWRFIIRRALMTNQTLINWAEECIEELNDDSGEGGCI